MLAERPFPGAVLSLPCQCADGRERVVPSVYRLASKNELVGTLVFANKKKRVLFSRLPPPNQVAMNEWKHQKLCSWNNAIDIYIYVHIVYLIACTRQSLKLLDVKI